MHDLRRVRFANIEALERDDLPLAAEVWLDDVMRAGWVSRDAMKLAVYLVRYMATPDTDVLDMTMIESSIALTPEDVRRCLVMMHTFGAVDDYVIEDTSIRVALCLSLLQRLQVLDGRRRLDELTYHSRGGFPLARAQQKRWTPSRPRPAQKDRGEDASAEAA